MTVSVSRSFALAAALAVSASVALPALAEPFDPRARNDGVSITITKQPSYLNTRATPLGPTTQASYRTSAIYQPFQQQPNSISFYRGGLPGNFEVPGF
ncbi:hypothetical protein [Hansschlegelia plantiphila]|nr:hypothetical protein [Hansschlegelia plantiphila]